MWNQLVKDLGEVKVKEKKTVKFHYSGDITVTTIEASCGCTSVNWHSSSNTLSVSYVGEKIPLQIIERGDDYFFTTKSIVVKSIVNGGQKDWSLLLRIKVVQ